MRIRFLFFVTLISISVSAAEYKMQHGLDSNGFKFDYVTHDPFNARIYTLRNGMKVYLSRIPLKPQVSFKMAVRAGLADSPPDVTGLAHYFEHMMFKGTDQIGALDYGKEKILLERIEKLFEEHRAASDPKKKAALYAEIDRLSAEAARYAAAGEYSQLITSIGGSNLNAFTAQDMTVYVVNIPSNELPKLLKLEAERMRHPVMRLFHTELEAVYEEYNRGRDSDSRMVVETLWNKLYAPHPYSWTPLIGKPEHLKNPSILRIKEFFAQYYVPANMLLALGGDLDFDSTIKLIDQYFSGFPAGKTNTRELPKALPLLRNQTVQIVSPKSEFLRIGFRVKSGQRNDLLGLLLSQLLSNGSAGLMDRNLIQPQKVLSASATYSDLKDYSCFVLSGRPRAGQTLDQLANLLLAELDKVKQGKFDPLLLKGIIANSRKAMASSRDSADAGVWTYLDSFIKGIPYEENLRSIDDLEKLTAQDVINFANSLGYYVRIDKVTGKASDLGKVAKPKITPVAVNADKQSEYGKRFKALPPSKQPGLDVVDFRKDIDLSYINSWDRLFYSKRPAPSNKTLFQLNMYIERGAEQDPLLPIALDYLDYLGTNRCPVSVLKQELYRNAMALDFACGAERSFLHLSGFGTDAGKALSLAADFLKNMKPDEKAWKLYVDRLLKARADAKKNQNANFMALNHWAAYGSEVRNNPTLLAYSVSEKELRELTGADMVRMVQHYFNGLPRLYAYVGPSDPAAVKSMILKTFADRTRPSLKLKTRPRPKLLATDKPRVFLLPYDSQQLLIGIRARKSKFDLDTVPEIALYNQYFGIGGLDNVVFQEIRESRSLAYSAYAVFNTPMEEDRYNAFVAVIGTQPDKFFDAAEAMFKLIRKMPLYPEKLKLAQRKILKNMSAERHYGLLVNYWFLAQKLDVKKDWRPALYQKMEKLTPKDIAEFAAQEVARGEYDIFVLGPVSKIDKSKLKKYGEIIHLTPSQVFGY